MAARSSGCASSPSLSPSTLNEIFVDGPAGRIETSVSDPGPGRRGIALIAHPHPLHGGTKDNKVVSTLARAFFALGYVALRPNFRGVGASAGSHDEGIGETEDIIALAGHARREWGEAPLLLAGFSFGSFVQARAARRLAPQRLVLIAPPVSRFETGAVAHNTLVIHGEHDDVVPLSAVLDWARPQNLPVIVVPGGDHFFHGRLGLLQRIIHNSCACLKAD